MRDRPPTSFPSWGGGVEFQRPLGNLTLKGDQVYLDWHATYTTFLDALDFIFGRAKVVEVSDQWEIGVAFSKGQRKLNLWRFEWDRLGLAYRFSSDGDFEGLMLVFRAVFDR